MHEDRNVCFVCYYNNTLICICFADRKFKRIIDPNWRPETAIQNAERVRYLEAGPGYGDMENEAKCADKFQKMRSNQGKYFKEIEDKVAVEEKKEVERIEFRR